MLGIGPWELVVILIIALLVVGPKRLPEVMRAIGRVLAELRKTAEEIKEEVLDQEEKEEIQKSLQEIGEVPYLIQERLEKEIEELNQKQSGEDESGEEKKE